MSWDFRPARSYTEQHGLFIALVAATNAGKTFSALRLARGIAGPQGKIAVLDTEGGRTLHLKEHFDFDVIVMGPPHRPDRYFEAAQAAQAGGYAALVIDSWTQEWRGIGGVLDWMDEEAEVMLASRRSYAERQGWTFDESKERMKVKQAASIRPKMAHKLAVNGFLGLRIPVVFSIRGELSPDPDDMKKTIFRTQTNKQFPFELTVSFRLAADKKGVLDLSDATSWKMEDAHRAIFRDGDLLSEEHGAKLIAWARGGGATAEDKSAAGQARLVARIVQAQDAEALQVVTSDPLVVKAIAAWREKRADLARGYDEAIAAALARFDGPDDDVLLGDAP